MGTLTGVFGLFESRAWLAVTGALIAAFSIAVLMYAERQRALLKAATLRVGDRSIDSLNLASLQRRLNRSLVIQEAENLAVIDGQDLIVTWRCTGYCGADREGVIEFSIDADANIPFDVLDCFAFDVRHDPQRHHPIRPVLVGPDGIAKKIAIPLLAPLAHQDAFSVEVKYRLPHCLKAGTDYYTATLSFDQDAIRKVSVRLRFLHGNPEWVRAYEYRMGESVKLRSSLQPRDGKPGIREYLDNDENVPAQCARIYMFSRPSLTTDETTNVAELAAQHAE